MYPQNTIKCFIVFFIIQCLYSRYEVICKIPISVAQKDNIIKMIQCVSPQFTPILIIIENIIGIITIIFITAIITYFPLSDWILKLKVGWAIVHVWWKLIWLHSIGQANQKAVLSIARMQDIY